LVATAQNIRRPPIATDAGDRNLALRKLEEYVQTKVSSANAVVEQVMTQVPQDRIVPAPLLHFIGGDGPLEVGFPLKSGGPKEDYRSELIHLNALHQISERADIPRAYVESLRGEPWGRALLAENLNTLFRNRFAHDARFLTRSVGEEMRGFLSNRYRRMDSRPILDSLLGALNKTGAVISEGYAGDVRVCLKAILPHIVEPVPGEYMVFGICWTNSDYGKGAMEIDLFGLRLVCINGLIASTDMRKVHLGARLNDDLEYSDRTYHLDTQTVASAVRYQVAGLLTPAKVDELAERIRKSAEGTIDPKQTVRSLRATLSKTDTEAVVSAFNSPDVVNLPPGNTRWRLSNAISFLAGQQEDGDRALDLQRLAGEVMADAA